MMKFLRLLAVLGAATLVAACGGGDEVTNVTNNYPAETPVVKDGTVTLVVSPDPVSANAGMEAVVTAQVTCGEVTADGYCMKPVLVKDLTSNYGLIMYVEYTRGGEVIYAGKLGGGDAFVPNGALAFDRPETITVHISTSPTAALGTVPLQIGVNATHGDIKVVGSPLLTVPNGPVTLMSQYSNDFGPGDGALREVLQDVYTCPVGTTCTARNLLAYILSTDGAEFASYTINVEHSDISAQLLGATEFPGNIFTEMLNWDAQISFIGGFRVTILTTLRAGVVSNQIQFFDELGRPLYIMPLAQGSKG